MSDFQFPISIFIIFCVFIFASLSTTAQIAKNKCKFLGNIIAGSVPGDFATYWNQVTPENSGKWQSVENTKDVMNWAGLDLAYNYAKNNNFPFKQHTFVWGSQQPPWIGSLSVEEQKEQVDDWIKLYCERYPETDFIDVVNEPFHAPPVYASALGGAGTTGWDWVVWSFEKTRAYCPNAKLILNEYGIINDNSATDQYVGLINILKQKNLIDAIGVQGHRFELENAPDNTLKNNLDKLGATGLPVYISELDVGNIGGGTGTANDNQQLEVMQRVFPILWNHAAVHGITLWGYIEGQTWQQTAYLKRSNGTERPALTWLKTYVPAQPGGSFCLTTSLSEDDFNLNVYPNPVADGHFTVEMKGGEAEMQIIDSQGRMLRHIKVQRAQFLEVQFDAAPGLYILKISDANRSVYKKILVK